MVTNKNMVITMGNGTQLLVNDIQVINGVEYIVFYAQAEGIFLIATEEVQDNKVKYNFLNKEESLRIAKEIDNLKHKN
jgi:hypothetical protein